MEESINLLPFEKDSYKLTEIFILIEINNIGGGGTLLGIKSLTEIDNLYYTQFTGFDSLTSSKTETCDNYLVEFKFKIDSMDLDIFSNAETLKAFIIDFIERIKFESNFRGHERSYLINKVIKFAELVCLIIFYNTRTLQFAILNKSECSNC